MKTQAIFYHAGCPVCVAAEQQIADAIDSARFDVEIVHLGNPVTHPVKPNRWCSVRARAGDRY